MEKNHSSNGSSSRDSTPGSNNQTNNLIETSIRRSLDVDSFTKFQQVLEYLGEELYAPLYYTYNKKLQLRLAELGGYVSHLPEGFSLERYFAIKTVFFSFSFISNVGHFIVEKIRRKDEKAEDYFITLIKILVHHALTAKNDTANLALVELEQLSLERSLTLNQLYQERRVKFLRTIIKAILQKLMPKFEGDSENQNGNGSSDASNVSSETSRKGNSVIIYMTRALELFSVHAITNDDVAESLLIIVSLIPKEKYNDAIKVYLESLARCQRIETSTLIITHIQTIIVNLLLRRKMSPFDMTSSLTKLCSFCGRTLTEILTTKITSIKARLLLHYSIDEKTVKDGIYYLSKFEKDESEQPFEDEFDDVKSFIDYLSPSLIGILLGIDAHFNSVSKILKTTEGLRELYSLNKLISLLDTSQVQSIHVKLLSTLGLLLRIRPVRDDLQLNRAISELWKVSLSKLPNDLKISLRLNICVALYDLIEDSPEEVAGIYEDLLCKNKSQDADLKFLFFIPDIPPMKSVYSFLKTHVIRDDSVRNVHELKNPLEAVLPLMKNENQRCRQIATLKLKQILNQNLPIIISDMLINPDEPLESCASSIIKALLDLSSTSDLDCSALVGECLGLIGAVNPTRLDHLMLERQSRGRIVNLKGASDRMFITKLIPILAGSLFSDRRSESETASYALQVLVKKYNVLDDPDILEQLEPSSVKACQLCKDTSYSGFRKKPQEINTSVYDKFKSDCHYSYRDWLDKFCFNIISTMEDGKLQEVLYACSYLFRNNQALAEFILPLLIVDIVLAKFGSTAMIRREIMAIIDEDVGVSTQDLNTVYSNNDRESIQTLHFQCANMIFKTLESLLKLDHESRGHKGIGLDNKQLIMVREFTSSIPKDKLAILAYKCRSHARALYYLEQFLFENREFVDRYATTLQRIFVSLGDTHEAGGIEMIRTSPANLIDQSANREANGDFDGAFIGYTIALETIDRESELDLEPFVEDSLRSLSLQGDHSRLYERSKYFMLETPNLRRTILPYAIEACWKMSKWDELTSTFKNELLESLMESTTVSQGFLLKSTLEDRKHIPEALKIVRQRMMKPLSIAMIDQSAYFRGYQNLLALHSIGDFSLAMDALEDIQFETQQVDENTAENMSILLSQKLDWLFDIWDKRNKLTQPALRSLEPLLEWQRSISLTLAQKYPFIRDKIHIDVGKMWLSSADSATEAKSFRRSLICLNQAQRYLGTEIDKLSLEVRVRYYIEQAKLDWAQGEHTRAIRSLKSSMNKLREHPLIRHLEIRRPKNVPNEPFPNLNNMETCAECSIIDKSERCSIAELKMLLTQYCEEAAGEIPETLFFMYEECVHLSVNQEETYLRLARYYDKLIAYYSENPKLCLQQAEERQNEASQRFSQSLMSGDLDDVITKLMEHSIVAFGNSLKYGVRYVRESMPRMISIWYDLGSRKPPRGANLGTSRTINSRIESSIRFIDDLRSKRIPIYYFMTAISILLSRVCHQHSGVSKSTQEILEMLLLNYPHQITWSLVALINDRQNEDRVKVAKSLLAAVRRKNSQAEKVIRDTGEFSNIIHEICSSYTNFSRLKKQEKRKKLSGQSHMREICPAATKFDFSTHRVMIPIQATMRARLPMHANPNPTNHQVFPRQGPYYISSVNAEVKIFNSLQQPRQVGFRCDNGRVFNIICKVGDDLRKDSRCLEFFDLLNMILKRNRQSNERFLEIKTFLVLPLDSATGLIEMVPQCESIRNIVEPLYRERRSNFTMQEAPPKRTRDNAELLQHYLKIALPKVQPPALPTWFRRKFTEPTAWYMARLAFTRTAAVTSMGGYIIGLGDRHLDNILIDTITGKLVHVDFNLLFHQAEDLNIPERVPFRLTQNMVAAFGSLGTEGNFRKISEITMRVMRGEKDALLTTLIPFLHDPCSEWTKNRVEIRGHREPEDKHSEDKSARARLQVIEKKLKGFPRSRKFKPLIFIDSFSVEAQVDNLIEEATDIFNLALMYYGWCPHI